MNEEEVNSVQCDCDCDSECKCCGECASSERASLDEVRAKLKELQDLVQRCDGRVILSAIIENEDGAEHDVNASGCALAARGDSPLGVRWVAAFGYFKRAYYCFDGSAEDIGNGVRFIFENEKKNKERCGGGIEQLLASVFERKS